MGALRELPAALGGLGHLRGQGDQDQPGENRFRPSFSATHQ
jgi:hypothetical protein